MSKQAAPVFNSSKKNNTNILNNCDIFCSFHHNETTIHYDLMIHAQPSYSS